MLFRVPFSRFSVSRVQIHTYTYIYTHKYIYIYTYTYRQDSYVREAEVDSSGGFAGLRAGKCGSRPGTECRYAGGNDRYGGGRGRAGPLSDNLTRIHRRCIGGGGGGGEVKRELVIRASRISLQIHNESRRLALPSTFFSPSPSLSVNWSVSSSLNSLSLSPFRFTGRNRVACTFVTGT